MPFYDEASIRLRFTQGHLGAGANTKKDVHPADARDAWNRRPEGAATDQLRAMPWEERFNSKNGASPLSAGRARRSDHRPSTFPRCDLTCRRHERCAKRSFPQLVSQGLLEEG